MKPATSTLLEKAEALNKIYSELGNETFENGRKPGADEQQLSALQQRYSQPLPDSFKEFYSLTNGYEGLSLLTDLFNINDILYNNYDYYFDDFDDVVEDLSDDELDKSLNREDLDSKMLSSYLLFGHDDQNALFINLNKPTKKGEYQVVSFSYHYAKAWNSFPEFLQSRINSNKEMVSYLEKKKKALLKDWDKTQRKKVESKITASFSKTLARKKIIAKPVENFKWDRGEEQDITINELVAVDDDKSEMVRILPSLTFYMPFSPTAEEIKHAYKIYRKHISWNETVRMQNASTYANAKETVSDDWDFINSILAKPGDKGNWGLRTVDYKTGAGSTVDEGQAWFNFRATPENNDGKLRPAFLAIHLKPRTDLSILVKLAKDIATAIPFISGHGGYETFQSKINYKPTIEAEYTWAQRFAGIRIEEEDQLVNMWQQIWPVNWLTIFGKPVLKAMGSAMRKKLFALNTQKGISTFQLPNALIIQAGGQPTLGDVSKGQWPHLYSKVQAAIDVITLHPLGKNRYVFGGIFDEENMSAAWFNRLLNPEEFYRLGEKATVKQLLVLAKNGVPEADIINVVKELRGRSGKGQRSSLELSSAAWHMMQYPQYQNAAAMMYQQAIKWPNADASCYMNLLNIYLKQNNETQIKTFVPECIAAADRFNKQGQPAAGGIYWNVACVKSLGGQLKEALRYIRKSKETGFENFKALHRDADFKALWNTPEFEKLFEGVNVG